MSINKTKKGGKFLGKGSYGCAFGDPPLKCKNESSRNTRKVISKLMQKKYADEEIKQGDLWKDIDPEQKYSLYPDKSCNYNSSNTNYKNNMSKCSMTQNFNNNTNKKLVFFKHGGTDLYKLKPQSINYSRIFGKGLIHLLEGLNLAHKKGVIHGDIKAENIVADENMNLRFIDFGLSVKTDTTNFKSLGIFSSAFYIYWPFEVVFFTPYTSSKIHIDLNEKRSIINIKSAIDNYYTYLNSNKGRELLTEGYWWNKYQKPIKKEQMLNILKGINYKDTNTLLTNLDKFSFGILISTLLSSYFHHYYMYDSNDVLMIHIKHNKNIYTSINDKQTRKEDICHIIGISEAQLDWHRDVAKYITEPLYILVQALVQPDPKFRPDISECIKQLNDIKSDIKDLLNPKKVQTGLRGMDILGQEPDMTDISTPTV